MLIDRGRVMIAARICNAPSSTSSLASCIQNCAQMSIAQPKGRTMISGLFKTSSGAHNKCMKKSKPHGTRRLAHSRTSRPRSGGTRRS